MDSINQPKDVLCQFMSINCTDLCPKFVFLADLVRPSLVIPRYQLTFNIDLNVVYPLVDIS